MEIEGMNEAEMDVPETAVPAKRGRPRAVESAANPAKASKAKQARMGKAALKRKAALAPVPVQEVVTPYQPADGGPAIPPKPINTEPPIEWEVKFVFNPQSECMEPRQVRKLVRP